MPEKVKSDPKIKSKSKGRIEENVKNKSCLTTRVDPKQFLNPTPTQKVKTSLKLSQNQNSELKEL